MAKREVDVVIGAKTDDASFRQTEQKTKGFLKRLTGGGKGGDALDHTSRASERMGKIVQAVAIVEASSRTIDATFNLIGGITASMRGDMEASAAAIDKAYETMRTAPVIGSAMGAIETIMAATVSRGHVRSIEEANKKIAQRTKEKLENDTKNAAVLREQATAQERLQKIIDQGNRDRQLREVENPFEKEMFLIRERATARLTELHLLGQILKHTDAIHSIEIESAQVRRVLEEDIAKIRERRAADAQKRVDDAMSSMMGFFKTGKSKETEDKTPLPFRAGLPGLTQGLLLSGQATAAQTKSTEAIRRQQTAENTEKNTADTVSVLRQLLEATRGSAAPVLN